MSNNNNVISIFKKKEEAEKKKEETTETEEKGIQDFETIMRENDSRKEKLKKDRQKANKSVLRSYKIKS